LSQPATYGQKIGFDRMGKTFLAITIVGIFVLLIAFAAVVISL
jgi:hypothetical protein